MGQVCNILLKSFSSIIVSVQKYKMQIALSIQVQVDTTTFHLHARPRRMQAARPGTLTKTMPPKIV